MQSELRILLTEYGCTNVEKCEERTISGCAVSLPQLRDGLYILGNILYEDVERQIYIVRIKAGFNNMNSALVALRLNGKKLEVVGYAKEGIIKQNICEQAFEKLETVARGDVAISAPKSKKWLFFTLALVAIIGVVGLVNAISYARDKANFEAEVKQTIEVTREYNKAVEVFNQRVSEYNNAVSVTCIENIKGLPKALEALRVESENYDDVAEVVRGSNSKDKIVADTATIHNMTSQVEQAIIIVKQITAPTDEWIITKLAVVEGITGTQAVTEELDPDDLLGKEGGFSACVYFTFSAIDDSKVPGNSIVEKGTDAGGAIEVYATLSEAEARCEYLAGFDGTVLYSGSYAIVGTMVIRTSYQLTNEQQFNLTSAITNALTSLTSSSE